MARAQPGSWASPVNGDEARGTWFFRRESLWGYDASAVDVLLARVASEQDTARPAGTLVETAGRARL
jgi:hypothetical protein